MVSSWVTLGSQPGCGYRVVNRRSVAAPGFGVGDPRPEIVELDQGVLQDRLDPLANYRIRALLYAGKPDWALLDTLTPT